MWPDVERLERLTFSKVSLFRQCPERFRRRYVLGDKGRRPANLIWGSADHAGIEHDLRLRMDGGPGAELAAVLEVASQSWVGQVEEVGGLGEIDWGGWAGSQPGDYGKLSDKLRDRMLALVALYHGQVCPEIRPLAVEKEFTYRVPEMQVPLFGVIDVVDGAGDSIVMRDRKTASKERKTIRPEWGLQARMYQLHLPVAMVWDLSVKTDTPKVVAAAISRPCDDRELRVTERMVAATADMIEHCWDLYGPDEAWPDATTGELYGKGTCAWCEWGPYSRNDCAWWKGE